jgi:hypothetical protein
MHMATDIFTPITALETFQSASLLLNMLGRPRHRHSLRHTERREAGLKKIIKERENTIFCHITHVTTNCSMLCPLSPPDGIGSLDGRGFRLGRPQQKK